MLAIVDYGLGNLRSVEKALEFVGYRSMITHDKEEIMQADGIILPGVGAFRDAIACLKQLDLIELLWENAQANKPMLGICLGMQLLFDYSEENGCYEGLGMIKGGIKKIEGQLKVPHMGWNEIIVKKEHPLLKDLPKDAAFYFVHSYHAVVEDQNNLLATTEYGQELTAVVGKGNILGAQFHPEKSSLIGLQLLKNFGELVEKCS
jgi:glutamine amidotransferase